MTWPPDNWDGAILDAGTWQQEADLVAALELAAAEEYYARYCGYDRLLLAAAARIKELEAG